MQHMSDSRSRVVERAFDAEERRDWATLTRVVHPEALNELRASLAEALAVDATGAGAFFGGSHRGQVLEHRIADLLKRAVG